VTTLGYVILARPWHDLAPCAAGYVGLSGAFVAVAWGLDWLEVVRQLEKRPTPPGTQLELF
jgi:hypothetical protein